MEKKTNLSTIFLILALIVIVIMGYFIYKISNEKTLEKQKVEALESTIREVSEKSNDLQESLNKVAEALNKTVPAETTNAKSKEDDDTKKKIEEAFMSYIKKSENSEPLTDYRVDKIEIVNENEKNQIVKNIPDYKDSDILAIVTYSVKPKDINKTGWTAGNGEIKGEWIVNKTACVNFRNGEILSVGTGW